MSSSTITVQAPVQTPRATTPVHADVGENPHIGRDMPTPESNIFGDVNDALDRTICDDLNRKMKKKKQRLEDLRKQNQELASWGHLRRYHAAMAVIDVHIEQERLVAHQRKREGDKLYKQENDYKKRKNELRADLRAAGGAPEVDSEEDNDEESAANVGSHNTRFTANGTRELLSKRPGGERAASTGFGSTRSKSPSPSHSRVDEILLSLGHSIDSSDPSDQFELDQGRDDTHTSDSDSPNTTATPDSETSLVISPSPSPLRLQDAGARSVPSPSQRTSMTEDAIGRIIGPDNMKLVVVQVFLNRFQFVLRRETLEVLRDVLDQNKDTHESYSWLIQDLRGCFDFSALIREVDQVGQAEWTSMMYSKYKWNFYYIHGEPHPDVSEDVALLPRPFNHTREPDNHSSEPSLTMKAFLRLKFALSDPCCVHRLDILNEASPTEWCRGCGKKLSELDPG